MHVSPKGMLIIQDLNANLGMPYVATAMQEDISLEFGRKVE